VTGTNECHNSVQQRKEEARRKRRKKKRTGSSLVSSCFQGTGLSVVGSVLQQIFDVAQWKGVAHSKCRVVIILYWKYKNFCVDTILFYTPYEDNRIYIFIKYRHIKF
jgi:hypothetical protein